MMLKPGQWWTVYFSAILIVWLSACTGIRSDRSDDAKSLRPPVPGAQQISHWLPHVQGKRVALIVNQSSRTRDQHLVDAMLANTIAVKTLFAVEHGIRGTADAGARLNNSRDDKTGLPIISIYGKTKSPSQNSLQNIDVMVFDLQDVGTRFYTYLSSLHYVMQSCARYQTPLLVLDRPNPNGAFVDGPILDPKFRSFVGMHEIPLLHGMTLGELALMINGEGWLGQGLKCELSIVPVQNYTHRTPYELPVKPSPNLPNPKSVRLYPTLALFEATNISVGRGTPFPFQVLGGPNKGFGPFSFIPRATPGASLNPKHKNTKLYGHDLRNADIEGLQVEVFLDWYRKSEQLGVPFLTRPIWLDKLMGTEQFRNQVQSGLDAKSIRASWQKNLAAFKQRRARYLLYSDE